MYKEGGHSIFQLPIICKLLSHKHVFAQFTSHADYWEILHGALHSDSSSDSSSLSGLQVHHHMHLACGARVSMGSYHCSCVDFWLDTVSLTSYHDMFP